VDASHRPDSPLLVSFANSESTVEELQSRGRSHLALIDLQHSQISWVRLPAAAATHHHVTGLSQSDAFVFCACVGPPASVAVYRKPGLDLHSVTALPIEDVHDIVYDEGYLYVVATSEDSVYKFSVSEGQIDPQGEPIWRVPGSDGSDTHHINCLGLVRGSMVVSGFGPKAGKTWSTARGGYLRDITTGQQVQEHIYHPHTIFDDGDSILFCESTRGAVRQVGGGAVVIESGYTRGIARLGDGSLALGVSAGRKVSRSTGITNSSGDPGARTETCGILILGPGWPEAGPTQGRSYRWLDLFRFQLEIYEILPVDGVGALAQESIVGQDEVHCVPPPFAVSELHTLPDLLAEEALVQEETERLYGLSTAERQLLKRYGTELLAKEEAITELKAVADQRLELIESGRATQLKLIAELESKEGAIRDLDAVRRELESVAAERLALILEQRGALDDLRDHLLARDRSLAEKEAVIVELKAAADERQKLLDAGQLRMCDEPTSGAKRSCQC
jgi:hypothetical protein